MSETWAIIGAIVVPLVGFLFALYRWFVGAEEKRWGDHLDQEERRHAEHEKRWREHAERFLRYEKRIADNERDITGTRDELHRDYVREDKLNSFRGELRDDIGKLFQKLNAMSKDLNQVIGELKAKRAGK
ncbi:MAG: hypothetical protein KZQ99_04560 [Candidatus Thiodiazotropha sp. (ex Dulcina madagascariensis)]|nr:hypothetical protein [Candidatus Thiodiazotropha sp. (ex Dulcina madagascariensis)]